MSEGVTGDLTVVCCASPAYEPFLVRSLETIPHDMRVIVVFHGAKGPRVALSHPGLEVVVPKDASGPFRRGYLLNVGVRQVLTSHVLLADADHLYFPGFFPLLERHLDPGRVLRFFLGRLGEATSARILHGQLAWAESFSDFAGSHGGFAVRHPRLGRVLRRVGLVGPLEREYEIVYGTYNPCVYAKNDFAALRGYDESFEGWGVEDDDLTERGRLSGLRDVRIPAIVGHLFHGTALHAAGYHDPVREAWKRRLLGTTRTVNSGGWGDRQE